MGCRQPWPDLTALPWGTAQLDDALRQCCQKAGLSIGVMDAGSDVDTHQDLVDAIDLLANDLRPARVNLRDWILAAGFGADAQTIGVASISIIVPVFNDLAALKVLLHCLSYLQPGVGEVIVVDGNASQDCQQLCGEYAAIYLTTKPNRGAQLRLGSEHATGDILWFLHADSSPPTNSLALIREHVAAGNTCGYFRFRFDGKRHWCTRWLESAINLRARLGIPYGDQGLFVSKAAYARAGGHTATPLFEEVGLIKYLRREGGCTPVAATIGVSSRRWERDGWLQRSLHNRYLAVAFALGVAPERLARQYGQKAIAADELEPH